MSDLARFTDGLVEGRRGELVQEKRERRVWRVDEGGRVWFAKRGTGSKRREIRREAENARRLASMELGPAVVAAGAHDGAEWLVLAQARGDELWLPFCVREARVGEAVWRMRRATLVTAARAIRRLHDAGAAMPDLTVWHTFVDGDRVEFIDAARLTVRRGPLPPRARAHDLAGLLFSFPSLNMGRIARHRLISEATGLRGDALSAVHAAIDAEIQRWAARTRWRHQSLRHTFEHSLAFVGAGGDLVGFFENGLGRAAMSVVRTLRDRENRTLGRDADGRPLFFAKTFPQTSSGWSPAMREVAAIDLFQRAGIVVNRLAAYAEDVDAGSLVAVKAARGEPLDDLLRRGVTVAERRALAVQTARIWRRMRECGLRHRDAYPCHLFAAPWGVGDPLRFELRLIDLTRAGRAPFPKERWFVKDAAALWHGLPKPPVTRTDAVRWLREYFRIERLDARAKRFARRVAAKEARIAKRQARKRRA